MVFFCYSACNFSYPKAAQTATLVQGGRVPAGAGAADQKHGRRAERAEAQSRLQGGIADRTRPCADLYDIGSGKHTTQPERRTMCVCVCVCVVLTKAVCKMVACAILRVCQLTEEPAGAAAAEASCWANCFYFVVFFYLFLHDTHTPPPFADFSC